MLFELALGLPPEVLAQAHAPVRIHAREAVRAIIWRGPALLLVRTAGGDYKFPGGGLEAAEDYLAALMREVLEETGYRIASVGDCIGTTVERIADRFEPGAFFTMTSRYYTAEVTGDQNQLTLDAYEAEMGFRPVWIDPARAAAANEAILARSAVSRSAVSMVNRASDQDVVAGHASASRWIPRETAVLKLLAATVSDGADCDYTQSGIH